MFEILGLDAGAETVYDALVRDSPVTAGDISVMTGFSQVRLRTILRQFQEYGLASRVPGPPAKYIAVDPDIALDVLLLRQEERLRQARVRARELGERYRQRSTDGDPAQLVEVVVGREMVAQRVEQAQRGARQQLRCFDKPPYAQVPTALHEAELDLLRRGGSARVLYECSAIEIPGRLPDLETGLASGEAARVCPTLPTKMILVDDRLALLPLLPAPVTAIDSCVIVHRSSLLDTLGAFFETLWEAGVPLERAAHPDSAQSDSAHPDEARLLALMAAGLSDVAIGRQLGISYRTLQRRIHRLMVRMQAQTRFQLGARTTAAATGTMASQGESSRAAGHA